MPIDWQTRAIDYFQRLGKPRIRKHYRCGRCRARRSLRRELWQYVRPPRCGCKSIDWRLDMSRTREWQERKGVFDTCRCDGAHYPHRRGSVLRCESAGQMVKNVLGTSYDTGSDGSPLQKPHSEPLNFYPDTGSTF